MPPPWKTFEVNGYGASTSSTNPRACNPRDRLLMNPVKLGIRNHHEIPVDAAGLQWFVQYVLSPMYAPSFIFSFRISACASCTHTAPCIADGLHFNDW